MVQGSRHRCGCSKAASDEGTPDVSDGIGLAEAMLGLPGFRVLEVVETGSEVVIEVETTAQMVGCGRCGVRAEAQDRMTVDYRDLPCFGRPGRLVWRKRRWRCREFDCEAKTWTETSECFSGRQVLTRRAGIEACRQVGRHARPVAEMAKQLGVCWWTIMSAVEEHGRPLVDDPERVGSVRQLGVDETSYLKATRWRPTLYATGLIDLDRRVVIDLIEGNAAVDLRSWLRRQDPAWLAGIKVVATDLTDSYRHGMKGHLDHTLRVADPFHVTRVGNRCLDTVRRRVQQETLGHRGHKSDPLYRIRKIMLTGAERLDDSGTDRMLLGLRVGDPHDDVLGAWLAKESVRDVYLTDNIDEARVLLDKAITGCRNDWVPEMQSLGNTLARWRTEILNHHRTGASNGPTEALNLCIKQVKRAGRGFRCFDHYRLRVLLHTGGINWTQHRPPPPRIRTRSPHPDA